MKIIVLCCLLVVSMGANFAKFDIVGGEDAQAPRQQYVLAEEPTPQAPPLVEVQPFTVADAIFRSLNLQNQQVQQIVNQRTNVRRKL